MGAIVAIERPRAAERVRSAKSVQMNVRIDAELKREGDYALAQAGFTPTEAVRALYQIVAAEASDPAKVRELLRTSEAGGEAPGATALDQARTALAGFREHLGLAQDEPLFDTDRSYKDVYADFLMERYCPEDGDGR